MTHKPVTTRRTALIFIALSLFFVFIFLPAPSFALVPVHKSYSLTPGGATSVNVVANGARYRFIVNITLGGHSPNPDNGFVYADDGYKYDQSSIQWEVTITGESNVGVTTIENEDPENNYLKSLQWQTPILNKSYQVRVTGQRWPSTNSGGSGTYDPNWESTSSGTITNPIIYDTALIKEGDEYKVGEEVAVDSGEEIIVEAKAKDGGDAIENSAITIFWNLKDPEPQNLDAGSLSSSSSTTDSTGMATATLTCSTSGGDDHIVAGQDKSSDPASSCDSGKAIVGGQAQAALTYIYNQDNQLLFEGDGTDTTSYAYDANGNLTRKTDPSNNVTTYAYDYENRLTSISSSALSASYVYDANGNRTSKTENNVTTRYINDPNGAMIQVLQERDGSNNLIASYTYGNDLISQTRSSSTSYYLYDGLGSARILTDSSGDILNTYTYEAFGNLVASDTYTTNNYCFTGEQMDSGSNLYYLRARYYDSAVGRFMTRDPILSPIQIKNNFAWALPYLAKQPQSLNTYNYVNDNPVNLTDPRGLVAAQQEAGCDFINRFPFIGKWVDNNRCLRSCCDRHDECYLKYGCTKNSWAVNAGLVNPELQNPNCPDYGPNCTKCNKDAETCFVGCATLIFQPGSIFWDKYNKLYNYNNGGVVGSL